MADAAARPPRMTAEEFVLWALQQPEGTHYELIDGVVYDQAQERSAHALLKFQIARRLFDAVRAASLPCTVYPDGMAIRVDAETTFEPDCMVRCGPPLDDDALLVLDPLIVVEVRSPSTSSHDAGFKLEGYFRVPSVRHYLLFRTDRPTLIHHARAQDGAIATRIVTREPLLLDPPGLLLDDWWSGD